MSRVSKITYTEMGIDILLWDFWKSILNIYISSGPESLSVYPGKYFCIPWNVCIVMFIISTVFNCENYNPKCSEMRELFNKLWIIYFIGQCIRVKEKKREAVIYIKVKTSPDVLRWQNGQGKVYNYPFCSHSSKLHL